MTQRKPGKTDGKTRRVLVEVAERLLRTEGYAAVTSRRVAEEAGQTSTLVHYYFETMDDLFLAILEKDANQALNELASVLSSDNPLLDLWRHGIRNENVERAWVEYAALANHRKRIQVAIATYYSQWRQMMVGVIAALMPRYGLDPAEYPPAALVALLIGIGRGIAVESMIGVTDGHSDLVAIVDKFFQRLEDEAASNLRGR